MVNDAVYIDELITVSSLNNGVDKSTSETQKYMEILVSQFASSKVLSGEAWNKERTKIINDYEPALSKIENLSIDMKSTIDNVVSKIIAVMGNGYNYMDYSSIPKLEERKNVLERRIAELVSKTKMIIYEDDDVNSDLNAVNKQISSLNFTLNLLKTELQRLREFERIVNEAKTELNDLLIKIDSVDSVVDAIEPSAVATKI